MVIDEVKLAVRKGYEIIDIHEVYEYKVTQYYPQTGEGGSFVEYINTLLKLKAEARGYPNWDKTPKNEGRYINDFYASEGIHLKKML